MKQERIEVRDGDSQICEMGGIIITVSHTDFKKAQIIVGRPGMPNSDVSLGTGGATLFETPIGLFEVRLLSVSENVTNILLTEIAPRPGLFAGYVDEDVENAPFTAAERHRLAASLEQVRREISARTELSAEQIDFVARKLIEMEAAAERLGRKDWINWALGTLTSIAVTAALDPEVAKLLFRVAGAALSWVVGGSIKLLP